MPELLSPAGNFEKLEAALRYGADAVYLAGQHFGMRSQAGNFTMEELYRAAASQDYREAVEAGRTSVACGMAAYDRETDRTVAAVFDRADREMYRCKTRMKGQSQRP